MPYLYNLPTFQSKLEEYIATTALPILPMTMVQDLDRPFMEDELELAISSQA